MVVAGQKRWELVRAWSVEEILGSLPSISRHFNLQRIPIGVRWALLTSFSSPPWRFQDVGGTSLTPKTVRVLRIYPPYDGCRFLSRSNALLTSLVSFLCLIWTALESFPCKYVPPLNSVLALMGQSRMYEYCSYWWHRWIQGKIWTYWMIDCYQFEYIDMIHCCNWISNVHYVHSCELILYISTNLNHDSASEQSTIENWFHPHSSIWSWELCRLFILRNCSLEVSESLLHVMIDGIVIAAV